MNQNSKFWTEENMLMLLKLNEEGKRPKEISEAFGGKVTPSAVIGKRWRLGVPQKNKEGRGKGAKTLDTEEASEERKASKIVSLPKLSFLNDVKKT